MKFYYNGVWYNDLMQRVKLNDLLNNIKTALKAYKQHHSKKKENKQ